MSIIPTFLALLLAAIIVFALLSYAFLWYESANSDPGLLEMRFSCARLALAAKLVGTEVFALILGVLVHPFGWLPPRAAAAAAGAGTPVILLHGLFQSRACWFWTKFRLRRRGFHNLHALPLPPWKEIEGLTERVSRKVDELRHEFGIDRVHLVGHSMGGIIARNYLQIRGGANKVDRCILLGTPNRGSRLAPFALSPLGRLLMPDSPFLSRLNQAPVPPGVNITSIYTRHDNLVIPPENAFLEGVLNVVLDGMGHTSLLFHSRSQKALIDALTGDAP